MLFPGLQHKPRRLYASPGSWLAIAVVTEFTYRRADDTPISSHAVAEFELSGPKENIKVHSLELFMVRKIYNTMDRHSKIRMLMNMELL